MEAIFSKVQAIKLFFDPSRKVEMAEYVIVRTTGAGVHVGRLMKRTGTEVVLADARRLWRWRGANTLHEVALRGVAEEWTRLSEPVAEITVLGVHEVIPLTEAARANLTRSRWAQ